MNQLQKRNNIERKMTCHECSQIYTLLHTPKVASCNINEGSILKQQIIINLILLKLEENANAIHRTPNMTGMKMSKEGISEARFIKIIYES